MRAIGGILVVLFLAAWPACEIQLPGPPKAASYETGWRRTRDGWERPTWSLAEIPVREPALHPWVVGVVQLLLSVWALVAFPAPIRRPVRTNAEGFNRDQDAGTTPHSAKPGKKRFFTKSRGTAFRPPT